MEYYIVRDGEAVGPFSEEALAELAGRDELGPQTLVWTEGMTDWAEAGSVSELGRVLKGENPRAARSRENAPAQEATPESEEARVETGPDAASPESPSDADADSSSTEDLPLTQAADDEPPARRHDEDEEEAERARAARARRARQQESAAAAPRWMLPYARKPGTVPYRIDDGLREGWNAWKLHPIRALIAILLYVVVLVVVTAVPYVPQVTAPIDSAMGFARTDAPFDENAFPPSPVGQFRKAIAEAVYVAETSPATLILGIVATLLSYVLFAGLLTFHLRHVRGSRVSAFAVLSGFRRPLSVIVATILVSIIVAVGMVLFVLPGIWLAVKLMFVPMAIVDQKLGPIGGIKASWRATRALGWWQCFGIGLASVLFASLGLLAVFVGILVTGSIALAAIGAAYDTALANGRGR